MICAMDTGTDRSANEPELLVALPRQGRGGWVAITSGPQICVYGETSAGGMQSEMPMQGGRKKQARLTQVRE